MAALAFIVAGAAVIFAAVVLLLRDRRRQQQISTLVRARDDAITERDAAMLAGERMRRAVDSLGLGVLVFDGQGSVVYRNDTAGTYTSGRRTEAMAAAIIEDLAAGALAGTSDRRTLEQYGSPQRSIVLSALPLDVDDPSIGAVVLIDDVSERRRLEGVRRDFVANISHELKTPVGALSLLAETLLGEEDGDVVRRLAERILAEALRVGRTIDDLLELSRIEIDETFEHEVVHVGDVVSEAVQRIRPGAEQHGIHLEAQDVSREVATIGDRRQLVSALFNLLDNAVKYSEAGSPVEVVVTTRDRMWRSQCATTASASRLATSTASSSASIASTGHAAATPGAPASASLSSATSPSITTAMCGSSPARAKDPPSRSRFRGTTQSPKRRSPHTVGRREVGPSMTSPTRRSWSSRTRTPSSTR